MTQHDPKRADIILGGGLRVPLSGLLNFHSKSILHSVQHACDASRISAGVLFREYAPAGPNHAKHFQNLPTTRREGPKSSQIAPQTFPNPPKILPKLTQNRSRRPLGAHLGPMLDKSSISNPPKTTQKRPRVPKRGPRLSQTLPKWSPRPSQIRFLNNFLRLFFSGRKFERFFAVLWQNLFVFVRVNF